MSLKNKLLTYLTIGIVSLSSLNAQDATLASETGNSESLEQVVNNPLEMPVELIKQMKPAYIKAFKQIAPNFRGYRIPIVGRIIANNDFNDMIKQYEEGKVQFHFEDEFHSNFYAGNKKYLSSESDPHQNNDTTNIFLTTSGAGLLRIANRTYNPRKGVDWEDPFAGFMTSLFHETLHFITAHNSMIKGTSNSNADLMERIILPTSSGNFNEAGADMVQFAKKKGLYDDFKEFIQQVYQADRHQTHYKQLFQK